MSNLPQNKVKIFSLNEKTHYFCNMFNIKIKIVMKKRLFILASPAIIVLAAIFTLSNIMFSPSKLLMENMEALADDPTCDWLDGGPINLADCYDAGTISSNGKYRCETGTGENTAYSCTGSVYPAIIANKYKCYK